MKIGFRTIKTGVGVSISVMLAQWLHLEYFSAAGILTLLCIQKSLKQSTIAVVSRFFACMGGLFFSSFVFMISGYHPYSLLILLLLFIPLCVRLRIQEGIASSSVIIMHVYMHQKIEVSFFINEFLVVLVGLGVALLVNWYMPSIDKTLNRYKEDLDWLIQAILNEIAAYLREGYTLWDGNELLLFSNILKEAKRLALLDVENSLRGRKENYFFHYFENKKKQYEIFERMLPFISKINVKLEQSKRIGDFVQQLAEGINKKSPTLNNHKMLGEIREYHKQLPLPETRSEFENRANLYAAVNELERFIDTLE